MDRRTRVLLADPDTVSLAHMQQLLEKTGYVVIRALDGDEARAILNSPEAPRLAVLGSGLPGLGAIEVCRRVRQNGRARDAYLMLLTKWAESNDRVAALEAGADEILFKPVDIRELALRLQIGSRILAEQRLKAAHAETELFLQLIPSILVGLDCDAVITRWNLAATTTFGLEVGDVIGRPLLECGIKWRHPQMSDEISRWLRCEDCRVDSLSFELKGKPRFLGIHLQRMSPRDGELLGFIITGADVTDRKQLEEQLRQSQKLEAIGQLAAGVAHEINTPTQYVGDNIRFLQDSWPAIAEVVTLSRLIRQEAGQGPLTTERLIQYDRLTEKIDIDYQMAEIPQAIEQSLDGLQRVATIVRAVKEFSHPGSEEKRGIDVNKALESTIVVANNEWKYFADLELCLAAELPLVPALAGELNQVFLNLVVNAAHAVAAAVKDTTNKGRITVTTRRDGQGVEISIKDSGCGIPEEIRSRVFEPFFTTKPVGQGTGQGLALAHAVIVTRHQGKIWFESSAGEGTTFFVRLPLEPGENK
jgi:PAS domain S-box-containing protein